ncbi:MAG: hypothetical protein DDT23_00505 [candidate division WS2 bacterium]|nr:hypothetical protein [Candidatus Lithacetigena glycinireducens]
MMKENNCHTLRNNINQYLDDELNEPQKTELEQHLAECPDCRRIFHDFQFINTTLTEIPQVEVPLELKFKVLETIKTNKMKRLRILNERIGVAVFLTAALLIAIGLRYALPSWYGPMYSSDKPPVIQERALDSLAIKITPTTLEVANLKSTSLEFEELIKTSSVVVESKEIREKEVLYYIIVSDKEMDNFMKELTQFKEKMNLADALKTKTDNIESGTIYIYIKEEKSRTRDYHQQP